MTKQQLYVPKEINVGYVNRQGTYTGKLAYVIYRDEKGKLRKEASWEGWRDKKIDPDIFDNIPTEGFVINKNVGGHGRGWDSRQAKIRVYDPRGFEFEITLENLLYILENSSGMSYKGLEGEYIYGWDGKDMVLIPCASPDYKAIKAYNDLLRSDFKLTAKTIKIGSRYMTDKESEVIYLGRHEEFHYDWNYLNKVGNEDRFEIQPKNRGKKYWFYNITSDSVDNYTLNKMKALINDEPDPMTSEYQQKMFKLRDLYDVKTYYEQIETDEDVKYILKSILDKFISQKNDVSLYLYDRRNFLTKRISFNSKKNYANSKNKSSFIDYVFSATSVKVVKSHNYRNEVRHVVQNNEYRHEEKKPILIEHDEYPEVNLNNYYEMNVSLYDLAYKKEFDIDKVFDKIKETYLYDLLKGSYYQHCEYIDSQVHDKFVPINYSVY